MSFHDKCSFRLDFSRNNISTKSFSLARFLPAFHSTYRVHNASQILVRFQTIASFRSNWSVRTIKNLNKKLKKRTVWKF